MSYQTQFVRKRHIISRISRMEYNNQDRRLYFVLRDYHGTFWFSCGDDDEANNLSVRFGSHMSDYFEFCFDRNTGQLLVQPHQYQIGTCIIA